MISGITSMPDNVVAFRPHRQARPVDPWQHLTAQIVMEKHRRGELDPAVLEALLSASGMQP